MKNGAYTVLVASIAVLGAASSALAGVKSVDSPAYAYYMYKETRTIGNAGVEAFCLYRAKKENPKGSSTAADFKNARPLAEHFTPYADVTEAKYVMNRPLKQASGMLAFQLDLLADEILNSENRTTSTVDSKLIDVIVAKVKSHAIAKLGACPVTHPRAK